MLFKIMPCCKKQSFAEKRPLKYFSYLPEKGLIKSSSGCDEIIFSAKQDSNLCSFDLYSTTFANPFNLS